MRARRGPFHRTLRFLDDQTAELSRRAGLPPANQWTIARAVIYRDPSAKRRLRRDFPERANFVFKLLREGGAASIPRKLAISARSMAQDWASDHGLPAGETAGRVLKAAERRATGFVRSRARRLT